MLNQIDVPAKLIPSLMSAPHFVPNLKCVCECMDVLSTALYPEEVRANQILFTKVGKIPQAAKRKEKQEVAITQHRLATRKPLVAPTS